MEALHVFHVFDELPPAQPQKNRPAVHRIFHGDGVNAVIFRFSPGHTIPDHRAGHPILISCLRGEIVFTFEGVNTLLTPGTFVHLKKAATHAVRCPDTATEDAVLMVTMLTGEHA